MWVQFQINSGLDGDLKSHLSCHWYPVHSGRLKKPRDIDKWLSLRLCLSVRGMSVDRELGLYLVSRRVVMGQIML